jgi:hypothetical protein
MIIGGAITRCDKNAKEESFGSSLSRKACGSLRAEPSITKAQNQNAQRTIKAKQTSELKRRSNNKIQSVDNQTSTLFLRP